MSTLRETLTSGLLRDYKNRQGNTHPFGWHQINIREMKKYGWDLHSIFEERKFLIELSCNGKTQILKEKHI